MDIQKVDEQPGHPPAGSGCGDPSHCIRCAVQHAGHGPLSSHQQDFRPDLVGVDVSRSYENGEG